MSDVSFSKRDDVAIKNFSLDYRTEKNKVEAIIFFNREPIEEDAVNRSLNGIRTAKSKCPRFAFLCLFW